MNTLKVLALKALRKKIVSLRGEYQDRINDLHRVFTYAWKAKHATYDREFMRTYHDYHEMCESLTDVPIAKNGASLTRVGVEINRRIKNIVSQWDKLMKNLQRLLPYVQESTFALEIHDFNFAEQLRDMHWKKK